MTHINSPEYTDFPTNTGTHFHTSCAGCSKKITAHKNKLQCYVCTGIFHLRCANFTRTDVLKLDNINMRRYWTCFPCNQNIFPFMNESTLHTDTDISNSETHVHKVAVTCVNCNTCNKIGNKLTMKECWLCNNTSLSHPRCMVGELGCKKCLKDIYPGFEYTTRELYDPYGANTLLFNPFDGEHDSNYIGEVGDDENYEYTAWGTCSNLLNNCKYKKPCEINKSRDYEIKIFSINIRSLNNKIADIRESIIHYSKFDVLCFNETNCDPKKLPFDGNELELEHFHKPFLQSPARSSGKGGGLAIYVNKRLAARSDITIMSDLSFNNDLNNGEFLTIEIKIKNRKNIIISNMYRSPSGKPESFLEKLDQTLQKLSRHRNKHILFVSDSNIDLLKYEHFEPATKLVNCFSEHGFAPIISKPTRITSHSATLIDHIFSNSCHVITQTGIITETLSDHLAVFVNILLDPNKENYKIFDDILFQEQRNISEEKLNNFREDIANTEWDFILQSQCADEKFDKFEDKYREIYEKNFPKKTKTPKKRKNDKPWILPWLQSACDRKNNLYKLFVKHPTVENETKYKKMKKFVTRHVKLAKRKFYDSYFKKYSNDGRKQWQMINDLLNRKVKAKKGISKLIYNNRTLTNSQGIANGLNDFFCNIAQQLKDENSSTTNGGIPPDITLRNSQRNLVSMKIEDCSTLEIINIINALKNKATSDLGIQPLKFVCTEISPVLNHLISSSLQQGVFPTKLKCAKVIPLHKGGSKTEISNYRPISLLSCFSKIYEKIMHARLTKFLKENSIIYGSQYGFRSGHCSEHALLEAQNKIVKALERKQIAVLLLLDFSKAFDMVDHNILLRKLEHYGIRGVCLSWFQSYLSNRQQYVAVDNCASEKHTLKYAVPQGSILGPTLFILYINDLPNIDRFTEYIFFADDANLIITGNTYEEVNNKVNTLLQNVQNWVVQNGLKLNISKTKYMIFTNKARQDINVNISGVRVEQSTSERFLGVMIDSNLNWIRHINLLSTKISRNAGILYKLKGLVPDTTLKTIYNSFVQSHLNYCSTVWGMGSENSLKKLFSAQKKAIRGTDNKFNNYFYDKSVGKSPCHTKEFFVRLNILTLPNLISKNCLMMMHKIYLNVTPPHIHNMFKIVNRNNNNSRRDPVYFEIPYYRLKSSDKTLTYKGPILYNNIVNKLNNILTRDVPQMQNKFTNPFKSVVTSHLLKVQSEGDETWSDQNFILYRNNV